MKEPTLIKVPPSHEELRRELVAVIGSYLGLPPLERLAVIAIFLGQQVAANTHLGATEALDARRIVSF